MATSPVPAASPKSALLSAQASLLQSLQKLTLQQNYVPARLPEGKVVGIWGEAIVRMPDGEVRELKIGDMVRKGHVILTSQNGIVQLEVDGSRYARLPAREMLDAPAAGVSGGEDGSLSDSLRIARIAEVVSPAEYEYGFDGSDPYVPFGAVGDITIGLPVIQPLPDQTVNEGAGTVTFTITLSRPSDQTISVDYRTVPGTALAGQDYSAITGTLTFAPGETTKTLTVPVIDDTVFEGAETFTLELSNPVNTSVSKPVTTVTIVDDGSGSVPPEVIPTDDTPRVSSVSSPSTVEGGNLDFQVVLSNVSTTPQVISVVPGSGTATLGTDTSAPRVSFDGGVTFTPITGTTVTVPAGSTSFIVRIPTVDDSISELTETVRLDVRAPGDTAPTTGIGTITDNDGTPTVSISGPAEVGENAGTVTYTITLSNPSSQTVTVRVAAQDGTATVGSDYTQIPVDQQLVSFAPGETTRTVTLTVIDDAVFEGKETFSVVLDSPSQAALGTARVTTTISDDGTQGETDNRPTIAINDVVVNEAGNYAEFTVTLTGATALPVNVAFTTRDGTALAGTDYTATSGLLTFAPGETTKTIRVPIVNDSPAVYEGAEAFTVELSASADASQPLNARITDPSGTGTIVDDGTGTVNPNPDGSTPTPDDDRPRISINDPAEVNEGDGTNTVTFTVTLSNASNLPVTVAYATANGTALAGSDYVAQNGTLTFAPGQTTATITVVILDDEVYEGPESFSVVLSSPTNAVILDGSGSTTIKDDGTGTIVDPTPTDPPPTPDDNRPHVLAISNAVAAEGSPLDFTVTLSNAAKAATTVTLTLTDGSANIATDTPQLLLVSFDGGTTFTTLSAITSGTAVNISVPAYVTSFLVRVPTSDDAAAPVFEGPETLTLQASTTADIERLTSTTGAVPVTGTGTIHDDGSQGGDDDRPRLSINDVVVNEGAGTATFTVTLTGSTEVPVNFAYTTKDGTAKAGSDYTAQSGVLTFAPGETTKTITVAISNDTPPIYEGPETFTVELSAPVDTSKPLNAVITDPIGEGTIKDDGTGPGGTDDDRPTIAINDVVVNEAGNYAEFTVTLTGATLLPVHVAFATKDGTALAGTDYTATSGLLTFLPGETTKTIRVPIVNDSPAVYEGAEAFTVELSASADASQPLNARITDPSGTGTIVDDGTGTVNPSPDGSTPTPDDDRPRISINDPAEVNEGDGTNTVTFTVTLSNASNLPVTVAYATANGTALAGSDYVAQNGTLTFAPGQTTATITVTILDDAVYEGPESFSVELSSPTNAVILDGSGSTTIKDDGTGTVNPNPDGSTPTPDDDRPRISINDPAEVNEGDGTNTVTFTVTLSNASNLPVTVAYATANGTALAGSDYVAQNGTLTFAPGQTTATITVTILDDAVYEGPESFSVELSSPTNAVILDGSGIATIKDDGTGTIVDPTPTDPPPAPDDDRPRVLAISNAVAAEGSPLDFTVTLSNASTTATSITLTLSDGSGSIATDTPQQMLVSFDGGTTFTTLSGITSGTAVSISVPAGVTSFLVRVPTTDDTVFEGPETLTLRAATPTDTGAGTLPVIGTGTLYDDGTNKSVNDLVFSGALSEEGLSGGLADTTGATTGADTTNATTFTGTLALSSALTSAGLVLAWSATQAASLQSSATGTALTWTVSADGRTLTGAADGSTILTAVLNDTGAYSVTLSGPVRHAGSGEDTLSFNLGFTATQGSYSASGVATITVEDDAPATIADQSTSVTLQDTNLLITLDTSGSMLSTLTTGALTGTTRLDAAIAAIKKLLDSYAEFGNVAVQLVTFSDSATTPSSTWMSVSAAKLLLENLTTGGNTNYDAALAAAQAAFSTSGRLTTGQNVAYFFSDGNPTAPENSIGVNATEEAAWASFLASQQMNAYAIGMTSDVSASRLDPIAWTTTGGTAASSIIVTDLNQLSGVLQSTVPIPTGDLVTGGEIRSGGQIGADGGFVQSVTIDGISYTLASASARTIVVSGGTSTMQSFDPSSKLLTVTTAQGGRFIIDMDDGTYEYRVPASVAAKVATEEMRYVVSDKDGDTASATVTVRVNDPSIVGTIGNDSLNGTGDATTPDYILGLGGNDTLSGLGGSDTLVGGTGSDWLTGGAGNDVFAWSLNDQGSKGAPAVDTITDFEFRADILDLRDLLVGEGFGAGNTAGNLANYLDFEVSGTTTTIHVSTTGAFTGGTYSAAAEDQTIVLQNVDLPSALGLTSGATDAQIISAMLTQGKLVVDPASGT
ncbi:Calx-beta domain-containing protein [Sphaerotilus sulfidivorans]